MSGIRGDYPASQSGTVTQSLAVTGVVVKVLPGTSQKSAAVLDYQYVLFAAGRRSKNYL